MRIIALGFYLQVWFLSGSRQQSSIIRLSLRCILILGHYLDHNINLKLIKVILFILTILLSLSKLLTYDYSILLFVHCGNYRNSLLIKGIG